MPKFSNSSTEAVLAIQSAFLQTVSPYYSLRGGCGIPKVQILGTEEDYLKIAESLRKIQEFWPKAHTGQRMMMSPAYFKRAIEIAEELAKRDTSNTEFYSKIYYRNDLCGSGTVISEKAIPAGWILDLVFTSNNHNYGMFGIPQHMTEVPFQLGVSVTEYNWHSGIFHSNVDEERGILVPHFSHIIAEKLTK